MNATPWHIIGKYFEKKADSEEVGVLSRWLEEDKLNQKVMIDAFYGYVASGNLPKQPSPDKKRAWGKINKKISQKRHPKTILLQTLKYAAAISVLIVAFSALWAGYGLLPQQCTEIVAPLGQKSIVVLPDSSLVWLNSGSTLKYNGFFNMGKREVTLNGEAYFDVKKNKVKRFSVKCGSLSVNVYGTEFNIKNYDNDIFQEVTVAEGRVGISDENGEIRQLTKGDQALLNKQTNKIEFAHCSPDVISTWKNNELIFDNTPLEEAIKYLERWYGVNIAIDQKMEGRHKYTFKIKTESLREMLEMMKIMTPLRYEINGKEIKIKYAN